jgi:ABC-type lipoprotein export system ATPase subunit
MVKKELTQTFHQTIIAVTQDQDFAHNSDRIIEMSDGMIVKANRLIISTFGNVQVVSASLGNEAQ